MEILLHIFLFVYGVLNDFKKSIFDTQKQEEAHGNTKNKRKQKLIKK